MIHILLGLALFFIIFNEYVSPAEFNLSADEWLEKTENTQLMKVIEQDGEKRYIVVDLRGESARMSAFEIEEITKIIEAKKGKNDSLHPKSN